MGFLGAICAQARDRLRLTTLLTSAAVKEATLCHDNYEALDQVFWSLSAFTQHLTDSGPGCTKGV